MKLIQSIQVAGEIVDRTTDEFEAFGKQWQLEIAVSYNNNNYLVYGALKQTDAGLFRSPESWTLQSLDADSKDDVSEVSEDVAEDLIELARNKHEARNTNISVKVDSK